jgi:hypothetical protein
VSYTYSFSCPFCGGSWQFEQFASIAKDVFSGWDGVGECPICHGSFAWIRPGALKGTRWYEGKKHYKPHPCGACGRQLDGRRVYCNCACRQRAYRIRKKSSALRRTA